ncbi:MAG: 50S ribosomal protein L25 [Actinomycetota bacterium]
MADNIVLTVQPRSERGRSDVRKLRADGLLPGVIYGPGIDPVALSVPRHELLRVLHAHGAHPLVTVKVEGGREYLALVKDLQIDPVKQLALHVDFHRVQEDKPVQTEVEIVLAGTPEGVKLGGILEQMSRMVAIEALPRDLPESITYDVSRMVVGDTIRYGDLAPPAGVTVLADLEQAVASVVAPRVEEEVGLSTEDAEALAALSPEELEALKELAEAAEEAAPEDGAAEGAGEGEASEPSEGGEG